MRIVMSSVRNGTYNLVLEKYLLDHYVEDICLIWRNEVGVYVGRNQNTLDELNMEFVKEHKLDVFRRLSGGGTIFHDPNTVYYSFITKNKRSVKDNFTYWNQVIVSFLNGIGVQAVLSGRNDVLVNERKISGSAEHYKDEFVVHHGSLLFQTDIPFLAGALTPNKKKFLSKAVNSVQARVDNIANYTTLSVEEFVEQLKHFVQVRFGGMEQTVSVEEDQQVLSMIKDYYGTYEWNYGKSPSYSHKREEKFLYGIVSVELDIQKGEIRSANIQGDFFSETPIEELNQLLIGVRYTKEDVELALQKINVERCIVGGSVEDLLTLLW